LGELVQYAEAKDARLRCRIQRQCIGPMCSSLSACSIIATSCTADASGQSGT
jgi:hypothetical protein